MIKNKIQTLEGEKIKTFIDMIAPSIIKFNTDFEKKWSCCEEATV